MVSEAVSRLVTRCREDLEARRARINITLTSDRLTSHPAPKTFLRADMVAKETWAVPMVNVYGFSGGHPISLRMPDGQEWIGYQRTLIELAEGKVWRTVRGGARLPAEVLLDEKLGRPSLRRDVSNSPSMLLRESNGRSFLLITNLACGATTPLLEF